MEGLQVLFKKSETPKNLLVLRSELKEDCSMISFIWGSSKGYRFGSEISRR